MKFEYKLQEPDFLEFQLFTAQQRPRFYERQKNGRMFLAMVFAAMAIYFAYSKEWGMVVYFTLFSLVLFLFYPRYFRWRQKMHYLRFVRQHYRSDYNTTESFERKGSSITIKNTTGSGELKANDFDIFIETGTHFFLYMKSGSGIIIPKSEIDSTEFHQELKALNVPLKQELNWAW